ncbi:MAG: T9SS type A sorting domain-containing protein [Saprospiraceae bacterium]|nr:T9SS type A sorting domain-containing protein [Saprospiraceae bacterium]
MKQNFRHIVLFTVIVSFIFGLANSGSHPTSGNSGYTGAPGDSVCSSCHSPNNSAIDGNVTINGLPSTLMTNTTYTITVTVANPNGAAQRSGFQMLALNGSNGNAGSMSNNSSNTQIKTVGGKNYFGHSPASNFPASNTLSFTVNWTSPAVTGAVPEIKFYASAVIANGNGSTSGDRFVVTNISLPIQSPASPISVNVVPLSGTTCSNSDDGSASVNISGGMSPFNILWSNGQTTATATNLPSGNVSVTVTDAVGSSATGSAVIASPPAISVNSTGSIICTGNSNGTASASASGGTGILNYFWSNGGFGANQSGLSPGTYFVTVADGNGCSTVSSASVSTSPPLNISGNIQNVSCNSGVNGVIVVNVNGGNMPYNFQWNNGANTSTLTGLSAGNYMITVSDASGCSKTASYVVNQPAPILISLVKLTDAGCTGQNIGSVSYTISGGVSPYQISDINGVPYTSVSDTVNNLGPGIFGICIIDGQNCQLCEFVQINGFQTPQIVTTSVANQSCADLSDGLIAISVNGNSDNLDIIWSSGQTVPNLSGLSAGSYTVTVTDTLTTCSSSQSYIITSPSFILVEVDTITQASCLGIANGSAHISVSGGVSPYSYLWSNGFTTSGADNFEAGSYTITVSDSTGCSSELFIEIDANDSFELAVDSVRNITCFGGTDGSIILTESGAGYIYLWSNGSEENFIENVMAATYFVIAEDNSGCLSDTLFILLSEPSELVADVQITEISGEGLQDGQISVSVTGGTSPYQILWENGDTTFGRNNLGTGTYSFTITDFKGCIRSDSVFLNDITCLLSAEVAVFSTSCHNTSDGIIDISVMGNTGSFSILLSNDTGSVDLPFDELPSGFYDLYISDSTLCEISMDSIFISSPDEIVLDSISYIFPSDSDPNSGSIAAYVTGGTGNLAYNWILQPSNIIVGITSTIDGLSEGIYSLEVMDSLGCTSIFQPIELLTVGTNDSEKLNVLNVFPNPFQRAINIDFAIDQNIHSVELLDTHGRMLERFTVQESKSAITIEPTFLSVSGIYILKITTDKVVEIHRILKI